MLLTKLHNKISGFRDTTAFSNWPALLLQRLLFPREGVTCYEWKRKFRVVCDRAYMDDHSPKELLARGAYDAAVRHSLDSSGSEFSYLNIGANIGAFDIVVASIAEKSAYGLAFELNPRTAKRLLFNLELNRLQNVEAHAYGVSDSRSEILIKETGCGHNFNLYSQHSTSGKPISCITISLDDAVKLSSRGVVEWDLLKIDCEGAEYSIIRGASKELIRMFSAIVIEIHPPPDGESKDALYSRLDEAGFAHAPISDELAAGIEYFIRR